MLSYFVCPGGVVWITHGTADPIPRVQIPARALINYP